MPDIANIVDTSGRRLPKVFYMKLLSLARLFWDATRCGKPLIPR